MEKMGQGQDHLDGSPIFSKGKAVAGIIIHIDNLMRNVYNLN